MRDEKGRFIKGQIYNNKGSKGNLGKKYPYKPRYKMRGKTPWNKGLTTPEEIRQKMSLSRIGKYGNENHPNWKGNKVGYDGIHRWIRNKLGNPKECAFCGYDKYLDWASISHKAKRDIDDFIPLCRSCHRLYDYHKLTPMGFINV